MALVLLQLFLSQVEGFVTDQGGHGDLDPVLSRTFMIGAVAAGYPISLSQGPGNSLPWTNLRLADMEATLADTDMDVSTAVQLERLEEIERAITELDPSRFVLKDDAPSPSTDGTNQPDPPANTDSSESSMSSW